MIDWKKYFDAIYLLQYAGYNGRRLSGTMEELKRVGMLDSGIFHVYETIQSPLYEKLRSQIPHDPRMDNGQSLFSCTLGHYSIYKICELRKYERILILEDDIVFLKDIDLIEDILEKTPDAYDMVMYTHFVGIFDKPSVYGYTNMMKASRDGGMFYIKLGNTGPDIESAGMYSVSRNFSTILCGLQERYFSVSDVIFNNTTSRYKEQFSEFTDLVLQNTNRYICTYPLSLQKYYMESITDTNHKNIIHTIIRGTVDMYRKCGLDISDYNKFDEFIKDIM
jgi:GR25 family glycosyltransferase involved in LPS biosynthesis